MDPARTVGWSGECPHCKRTIRFEIHTDAGTFCDPADKANQFIRDLPDVERELIELAASTGVLSSFENALMATGRSNVGNTPAKFLRFIQKASVMKPTPEMLVSLRATFTGGTYRFIVLSNSNISAVIANDVLRFFVPTEYLYSQPAADLKVGANGTQQIKVAALTKTMQPLDEWLKTKMGYVPLESKAFLREVRKKNYGAFANISW